MGFWSWGPNFLNNAAQLAEYFGMLPGVEKVCLTGSLARRGERRHAHDIDLVLLHDGTLPDARFSLQPGPGTSDWYIYTEETVLSAVHPLHIIFRRRAFPIIRYLKTKVSCKVDIICVNQLALTSCDYLRQISSDRNLEFDPDFFKRIFCEISLLGYDLSWGDFESRSIMHKDGECCQPQKRWVEVQKDRKATQAFRVGAYWGH